MGTVFSNIITSVSSYYCYVSDKIKHKVYANDYVTTINPNNEGLLGETEDDMNLNDNKSQNLSSSIKVKYQLLKNNEDTHTKIEELTREINIWEGEEGSSPYKYNSYEDNINLEDLKASILNVNDYDKR